MGKFFAADLVSTAIRPHVRDPGRLSLIVFAILAALSFALRAWAAVRRMHTMRGWPTVEGVVAVSSVEYTTKRPSRAGRRRTVPFYRPHVIFRYRVGDIELIGEQFRRNVGSSRPETVRQMTAAFPVGKRILVHYDPNAPMTAVADPTAGMLPLALAAAAAVLLALAGAMAAF